MDQTCSKRLFPVWNRKSEHCGQIQHCRIKLSSKFQLKQIIFYFSRQNVSKKGISSLKQKELTSPSSSACSNLTRYQITTWIDNFDFLYQSYPKIYFPFKAEKATSPSNSACSKQSTTIDKIFETNSSFYVKKWTTEKVQFLFLRSVLLVLTKFHIGWKTGHNSIKCWIHILFLGLFEKICEKVWQTDKVSRILK